MPECSVKKDSEAALWFRGNEKCDWFFMSIMVLGSQSDSVHFKDLAYKVWLRLSSLPVGIPWASAFFKHLVLY